MCLPAWTGGWERLRLSFVYDGRDCWGVDVLISFPFCLPACLPAAHPPSTTRTKQQEILKAFQDGKSLTLTVLSACGIDQIIAYKEDANA